MANISQAVPPALELLFGPGKKPLAHFESVWLELRHAANQVPSAKLVLSHPGRLVADTKPAADDARTCRPGVDVTIRIKSGPVLFSGIVVQQEFRLTQDCTELTLKLRHPLQRLCNVLHSQVFEKLSDANIVRTLLAAHKVTARKVTGMDVEHAQMVQFACSDWQFLKARLGANGVWLLPSAETIDIAPPKLNGKADHTLQQTDGGSHVVDLEEANWQFSIDGQSKSLEVASWDIPSQKMAAPAKAGSPVLGRGAFDPSAMPVLSDKPWQWMHSIAMPAGEQMALADGRLLAQRTAGIQASFTVIGSSAYQVGQTVALTGFGAAFDGAGLVSEVRQSMRQGEWRTTVVLGQEQARAADAPVLPRAPGLHIGLVDAWQADPEGLSRLRVKVPALGLDNKPLWARFSSPYASKDSGLCLYPEAGDEVVIGFFDEDPRYPVILGAMHNPKNQPPYPSSKENQKKGLVFVKDKRVHQLLFDMKSGSAELSVEKKNLTIEKNISLNSDTEIALSAQQKINVQGKQGVNVKGSKVDLSN